eukprot:4476705-Amphidinium_carterae.1
MRHSGSSLRESLPVCVKLDGDLLLAGTFIRSGRDVASSKTGYAVEEISEVDPNTELAASAWGLLHVLWWLAPAGRLF